MSEQVSGDVVAVYKPSAVDADTSVSDRVLSRMDASIPAATRRAYAGDWKVFAKWCKQAGRTAIPATAETAAEYASYLADKGRAPATITRAMSSIRVIHSYGGQQPPSLLPAQAVIRAYRTERADAGLPNKKPATALAAKDLRKIAASLDTNDILQLRDRMILVLTWAMMGRRSTMTRIDIADVAKVDQGLDITVRRDKADQRAEGRITGVPYGSDPLTCPVRLVLAWIEALAARGITSGPLLRRIDKYGRVAGEPGVILAGKVTDGRLTGQAVNIVVQRTARAAGIDVKKLTAHSMRAGGASGAYRSGADLLSISRHGGWIDGSSSLLGYIRDVDRWEKNPMFGAGL